MLSPKLPSRSAAATNEWTAALLRKHLVALCRHLLGAAGGWTTDARLLRALPEIVHLGLQPAMQAALRGRLDVDEAVQDLATRFAFQKLMTEGQPCEALDPLSQALIRRTLARLYGQAAALERSIGENPLDEDPGLLLSLCRTIAGYVPHKPLGSHISWKLAHYEGAVSRASRQIENLVRTPAVTEDFVAFVLAAELTEEIRMRCEETGGAAGVAVFKARLALMARGGGRSGLDPVALVRFFALPATVAFVKRFAATVQPARTLYADEEYAGLAWAGRRALPREHRQGYLEAALWQLERQQQAKSGLQSPDPDELDESADPARVDRAAQDGLAAALRSRTFECWVVETALEHRPAEPFWQAAELLYVRRLTNAEILRAGLADAATLEAVTVRLAELAADDDLWQSWLEETLAA